MPQAKSSNASAYYEWTIYLILLTGAATLLWLNTTEKAKLDEFYTSEVCSHCYTESVSNTKDVYDYANCGSQTSENLLPGAANWWFFVSPTSTSPRAFFKLDAYLPVALLILILPFLLFFHMPCCCLPRQMTPVHTHSLTVAYVIVASALMASVNKLFQLHLKSDNATGCYVSSYGQMLMFTEHIWWTVAIGVAILGIIGMSLLACCSQNAGHLFSCTCLPLTAVVVIAQIVYSFFMAIDTLHYHFTHLICVAALTAMIVIVMPLGSFCIGRAASEAGELHEKEPLIPDPAKKV